MSTRTFWKQPDLDDPHAPSNRGESFKPSIEDYVDGFVRPDREMVPEAQANLVSSFTTSGKHMPVIDIDLPCRLVPSKTPGHFHLYIDSEMDLDTYMNLLHSLVDAGIVEHNYAVAAEAAGMSFVRKDPEKRPDRNMTAPETFVAGHPCSICGSRSADHIVSPAIFGGRPGRYI